MILPHPLSIITIVFGILFTMRKLDVGHRMPEHHPGVPEADFARWKTVAMAAYGFGVWACFLKLVADFGGSYAFARLTPSVVVARSIGVSLDVAWVIGMIISWRKVQVAHRLAERVGIEKPRGARPAEEQGAPLPEAPQGSPPDGGA